MTIVIRIKKGIQAMHYMIAFGNNHPKPAYVRNTRDLRWRLLKYDENGQFWHEVYSSLRKGDCTRKLKEAMNG